MGFRRPAAVFGTLLGIALAMLAAPVPTESAVAAGPGCMTCHAPGMSPD